MSDTQEGYAGWAGLAIANSEFNKQWFLIKQLLGKFRTCTIGQVTGVTNEGDISPVGFIDFQPLINMQDGIGTASFHQVVNNIPYFRLQGGSNAIIIDPQVGDIGIVVCSDRDSSSVKNTKARANPGSRRRGSFADGIYIGGILNGTPAQFIQFNSAGITITDINGNIISMSSGGVNITSV